MALQPGSHVGPYEIVATLGAGGMGEVFRARDTRLQRDVALKVMREISDDPERQRRFVQEARSASALNHPNIITVHDVGLVDGVAYIVSELVDGESLTALLARGPLAPRKALDIAVQIADGLSAAHAAGIVHRDLKPANIMLTKAGLVKILDFGLAKPEKSSVAGAPVQLTAPGMVVGTPRYMSPEQARGGELDVRSDQFSFGLILYEMLTGKVAFERTSAVSTMAAILDEDYPPLESVNSSVPAPLRWCVERCLAKDPDERYASTADLCRELSIIRNRYAEVSGSQAAVAASPKKRATRTWPLCVAVFVLLAVVVALLSVDRSGDVRLADYHVAPLATDGGFEGSPAWSPDGKSIVYTANAGGVRQVMVRGLDSPVPAQITHSVHDCTYPFWSRDGARIFYTALDDSGVDSLWMVGASGGAPQLVLANVVSASMSPDGHSLAYLRRGDGEHPVLSLWLGAAPSVKPTQYVTTPFERSSYAEGHVRYAPDGKSLGCWLATWTGKSEFWIIPAGSGAPRMAFTLPEGMFPFNWMPDGKQIVFGGTMPGTVGADLHLLDIDSKKVTPLTKTTEEAVLPAASPDGKTIAFTVVRNDFDLLRVPLDGSAPQTILASSRNESDPSYSPGGQQIAYVTNRTGTAQIWVKSLADGWQRPMVTEKDFGKQWINSFSDLAFSPDGQRIAYCVSGSDGHSIYVSNTTAGSPVKLTNDSYDQRAPTWSPDGNWIAYMQNQNGNRSVVKASSGGDGRPTSIKAIEGSESSGLRWSPKGDWIAYATYDGLHLLAPDGTGDNRLDPSAWKLFAWSNDPKAKVTETIIGIVQGPDRSRTLVEIDAASGKMRVIGKLDLDTSASLEGFTVAPDASAVATGVSSPNGDIWLLRGFTLERSRWMDLTSLFHWR